jgi:transcriptional regulator with XRE-family HTH domain
MTDRASDTGVTLPERLRAAREAAGLSQGQVAKLMNMHRPTISEIEAGNRKVSTDELSLFAAHYDVKESWLLGKSPDRAEVSDPKLQLAARELSKLKPEALDNLLKLIAAMKDDDDGDER